MPTYQYRCTDCEYEFEEFQSISSAPITICPKCNGKTERVITGGSGLIFKGSGFYITENRSSKYKSEAAKEGSSSISAPSTGKTDKKAK